MSRGLGWRCEVGWPSPQPEAIASWDWQREPQLPRQAPPWLAGMVFAAIWAALMYATGMISNIGIEAVADLAESDPDRAVTVWSTIDTVTNGLGGGNELVGGIWILLVSIAGLLTARLPRWLNVVGIVTAVAGLLTVIPAFEAIEMVFGLGSIVWFIGIGAALLRSGRTAEVAS